MTKVIILVVVIAVLYGGWELFLYWDKVNHEEENSKKLAAASEVIPEQLQGVPQKLDPALQAAQKQGASGLRNFLKTYGRSIQDPRKAWIELDYCLAVARDDPAEAKRVFAEVQSRTGPSSPVYPRIKKLEATYK
jgi:hypothetical protein